MPNHAIKEEATIALLQALAQGKQCGETKGWLSAKDVRAHFEEKSSK